MAQAQAAREANAAEDERLGALAVEDSSAYVDDLHSIIGRHVLKLMRAEEHFGGKPS